ncbi:hypothetical protein E4U59_007745 [Claviceps monticola]|nr:hypothetical protein E4U59_007745 [Claviceps monticola]
MVSLAKCTTLLEPGIRFGHADTTSRLHLRGDALPCDEAATDVPRVSTAQTTHVSLLPSITASTGTPSPVARISADEPSVADEDADTLLNLDLVGPPDETAAPALGTTFRHADGCKTSMGRQLKTLYHRNIMGVGSGDTKAIMTQMN